MFAPDRILRTLASLRIAIVILTLIVLLIFFGSLEQRFTGIWHVLEMYFKNPFVWVNFKIFAPASYDLKGGFPFLGGVTLGVALLINLGCAFVLKFQPTKKLPLLLGGACVTALGATLVTLAHVKPEFRQLLAQNPVSMLVGGLLLYIPITLGFFLLYSKKAGMVMAHVSILLLVVGQGITSYQAVETRMILRPGETRDFTEDSREYELAVITPKKDGSGKAQVECVPQSMLEDETQTTLTLGVTRERWFKNPGFSVSQDAKPDELLTFPPNPRAPMLVGKRMVMEEGESVTGLGGAMDNLPGMLVAVGGRTIALYGGDGVPRQVPGTDMRLQLRPKRHLLPYAIRLEKFTHDLYPGTNTPKNYASQVTVMEQGKDPRKVEISMNQPLRLARETFFQASFLEGDSGTVLQVVRNPGWTIPYIACALGAIGLLVHFVLSLLKFLKRTAASTPKAASCAHEPRAQARGDAQATACEHPELALRARERKSMLAWLLPAMVAVICALGLGWSLRPASDKSPNVAAFGNLPVIAGGRVQPIDSLARNSLLALAGKSTLYLPADEKTKSPARTLSATEWLLDVITQPDLADSYPLFRIDHEEVKALIGQKDSLEKRFSMAQIKPHFTEAELGRAFMSASNTPRDKRDAREHALVELSDRISQYAKLRGRSAWLAITPPTENAMRDPAGWLPLPDALATMQQQGWCTEAQIKDWAKTLTAWKEKPDGKEQLQQQMAGWADLQQAWGNHDHAAFDAAVAGLRQAQVAAVPAASKLAGTEAAFNRADPFYLTLWLYVCAALAVFCSWMFCPRALWRTAFTLVGFAFLVHTGALIVRIWLSGRPPVTNLYSSAVFVGWGLAGFALVAEYVLARFLHLRTGFALLVGAVAGAATLMIANALAADGDTLAVLMAVLDTNFWLGTHVVIITLGYSATFLAGMIGITQLLIGLVPNLDKHKRSAWITGISVVLAAISSCFAPLVGIIFVSPSSAKNASRALTGLVYGTVCFALLFSFIGTILGGIWADQSWGRFWGWDPKENGAMMIVLWNAVILHARMGGLVKERGLCALAVLGNIVTAWSWFGVNQLGAGLHSYGFTSGAALGLISFIVANLLVAGLALLPGRVGLSRP